MWLLNISPHLKCVATLSCDLSLITTLVWECRLFSGVDVLQGSVTTRIRCGEIFNNSFITNFLANLTVKKLWKSVKVWWSYCHEFGVSLVYGTRCSKEVNIVTVQLQQRRRRLAGLLLSALQAGDIDSWLRACCGCRAAARPLLRSAANVGSVRPTFRTDGGGWTRTC